VSVSYTYTVKKPMEKNEMNFDDLMILKNSIVASEWVNFDDLTSELNDMIETHELVDEFGDEVDASDWDSMFDALDEKFGNDQAVNILESILRECVVRVHFFKK